MKQSNRPLLTVGMIFKNEIRCLERCLEALKPLRKAFPCELILADTGSDDGSREIAARYADVLFDFPWVDDFSAARNAVMDRARGKWYLTVDADEYLDLDFHELERFLKAADAKNWDFGAVIQRNYKTQDMAGDYTDAMVLRLVRMSAGVRYEGTIHEAWPLEGRGRVRIQGLSRMILHHDGYAGLNEEQGRAKRERNLRLLREELKKEPQNLRAWLQYIESGNREDDYLDAIRKASGLVEKKCPGWKDWGAAIFRHAVWAAMDRELLEAGEWIERARKWFPDSLFTRIDVEYAAMHACRNRRDYAEAIRKGNSVLEALGEYRAGQGERRELLYDSLLAASAEREKEICACVAEARLMETQEPKELKRLLEKNEACLTASVLAHALRCGILLPLSEKPLYIEEMDALAARLLEEPEELLTILDSTAQEWAPEKIEDLKQLVWLQKIALATVRAWRWGQEEREAGLQIARFYARIEGVFLLRFYTGELQRKGMIRFLPAIHQFGGHCVQAFEALRVGDKEAYVQELEQGAETCADMQGMVDFLLGEANCLKGVRCAANERYE
ncbi:MAG: glycosyltransferase [Lachnospiraceae bacterium]|nr:glycosyltransferase [Lachnospiraceae bacterium]